MGDSVIVAILILHTSTLMMSNPRKFSFFGTIPEAILVKVPIDNVIVNEYRNMPTSGVSHMIEEL